MHRHEHPDRPRRRSRLPIVVVAIAVTALVALTACESDAVDRINQVRATAGRPALPMSEVLRSAARAHSTAMCAGGLATASVDPAEEYDQETAAAVTELVGSAPLDPAIDNWGARNRNAQNAIWASWMADPVLAEARWDDIGVGEVECEADGTLYMTAVLRDAPTVPATGRYASVQYTTAQIQTVANVQYGSAINYQNVNQPLLLDLYLPPNLSPAVNRPTIVLVHGGAFAGGNKSDLASVARAWATKGYVAISIGYRLDPRLADSPWPPGVNQLTVAAKAIDDAMESVRWIKANAATYKIDPTRIGMVGYSAGGAIVLGVSIADDLTPTGPLAAYSPSVNAVISTGAHLTPGIEAGVLTFQPTDAPALMFHYETDVASGTDAYAFQTCAALRAGGSTCDYVLQPGEGHTTDLHPSSYWWTPEIGPFFWTQLRLATAP